MQRLRNLLPYVLLAVAGVLEWVIVTHLHNAGKLPGDESGPWSFRGLDGAWLGIFSWAVVVCVAVVFVVFFVAVNLGGMLGLMLLGVLVELTWGRDLPRPQNRWDLGLAFLAGAMMMFVAALRQADFIGNARTRLGAVWHSRAPA
jgi:hypothetical protein